MKFTCPHCGEKTFSPIQKALCGGMSSSGKRCPSCNARCVNGKLSLAFSTILRLSVLVIVIYNYFTSTDGNGTNVILIGAALIAGAYAVGFLFDMFFGKLIPAIKRE